MSRDQYWPTTVQYSPHLEHASAKDVCQEGEGHAGHPKHQGQQLDQQTHPGVGDIVQRPDVVLGTEGLDIETLTENDANTTNRRKSTDNFNV